MILKLANDKMLVIRSTHYRNNTFHLIRLIEKCENLSMVEFS